MILPAATCSVDLEVRLRSSSGESTKFEWPRIERPLSLTEPGRERRLRPGRLAELDDSRPTRGCVDRRPDRRTPQRIDDEGRAVASAGLAEPVLEAVAVVELHGRVRPQLERSFELGRVAACGHDALRTEKTRRLHGDRADGSRRAEDEHAVAGLDGRSRGDGHPARDAGDSAHHCGGIVDTVGHGNGGRLREVHALCQEPVPRDAEALAEEVHPLPGDAPDGLAARDVRQRRMPGGEAAGADGEVDRVECDRDDLDVAFRIPFDTLGRLPELDDLRSAHDGHAADASRSSSGSPRPGSAGATRASRFRGRRAPATPSRS